MRKKPMDFESVQSSNIEGLAYDHARKTLHVKFKGGFIYSYRNVTPEHYAQLKKAPSIGKHFNSTIRANPQKHPFQKADEDKRK